MEDAAVTILLVEDEEAHAEAVRRAFGSRGTSVRLTVATSLHEARACLTRAEPDLVIADWLLPDGKGIDLLPPNHLDLGAPLIVLTSRGSESVAVEAIKAGALDYVVKSAETFADMPHVAERALRQWENIMERKRAERALQAQTDALAKRVKELNCLFEISNLMEDQNMALDPTIQAIVDLVPLAWQYPEICSARAVLSRRKFMSANFRETMWKQTTDIVVHGKPVGTLEVNYLQETAGKDGSLFLEEEGNLLSAIAERLGRIVERKEAKDALKESEERFRAVFEAAKDCIFIKNLDRRYTHVNPAVERLLGLSANEILGCRAEDIFGEEAAKRIGQVMARVLKGEWVEEEHTRIVRGELLTFHDITVPLRNSRKEIVGTCTISRDITERKRAIPSAPITVMHYPSASMTSCLEKASFASSSDGIVLLQGESGSGKDYLARWIHDHSRRAKGPFLSVNCAAISHELAESELFGHEPGSFTGARGRKRGLLELAEGGTLLLNEIGELSLSLQSKLLTFLDTRSFFRVGGQKSIHVDARLIAATHRDLEEEAAEGRFLRPLLYRLDVFAIHVPPLRERQADIPVLVEQTMARLATEMQLLEIPQLNPSDIRMLTEYDWPGNVRELHNVLERALMVWQGGGLTLDLPKRESRCSESPFGPHLKDGKTLKEVTDEVTRALCEESLRLADGNKKEAAKLLGISRAALYRHLERLGIVFDDETNS